MVSEAVTIMVQTWKSFFWTNEIELQTWARKKSVIAIFLIWNKYISRYRPTKFKALFIAFKVKVYYFEMY